MSSAIADSDQPPPLGILGVQGWNPAPYNQVHHGKASILSKNHKLG